MHTNYNSNNPTLSVCLVCTKKFYEKYSKLHNDSFNDVESNTYSKIMPTLSKGCKIFKNK